MRHSIAGRSTIAGTNLRPMFSLYATATFGARVREITITNTTSTAFAAAVARLTNTTTQGAALTECPHDINPPQCTGFAGHTADGGIGTVGRQVSIGAAVGSGFTWTFGDNGLVIPVGTSNGVGIIIPTGSGQVCDYYLEWEE